MIVPQKPVMTPATALLARTTMALAVCRNQSVPVSITATSTGAEKATQNPARNGESAMSDVLLCEDKQL